ncbi:MAG TPA: radical SAM protein [Terriglobia bacterium]|jgi:anaerobic magnesium-protoporphyrin IX monomethyl ester cyclase|nr:radical SAM protein [Terriglobia bacterium]
MMFQRRLEAEVNAGGTREGAERDWVRWETRSVVDVLLTHSYHLYYDHKQVRKMQPYPPLGTLYAAALLRQQGFSVALFDTMLQDPERGFAEALERHRPRVVAIYEDNFNFLSKMCLTRMRRAAYDMLEAARAAGATIVVNGSDASDHIEEYLGRGADYVLLGEAEWTLLELVQSLLRGSEREPEHIPGVTFRRHATGQLFRTPSRPLLRDLDALPPPARDLIDWQAYRQAWKSSHELFSVNLVASRGCPYRCNWCARPIYGDSFHVRSAESVADEMQDLQESVGAEHFWFADDVFGLRHRWVGELADAVERRRLAIPFKIQSRINLITPETAGALRRAGCSEVWMGVESGSQRILDAMEKGTRLDQIPTARENLRQNGVRACFFIQFGYPGETWNEIRETIELVRSTRPDDIGVSVSYPLPGTKFYERVREELGEKRNWSDSDDLSVMFSGAYTSEFYRAVRDALHAEVESWSRPQGRPADSDGPADRDAAGALRGDGRETISALWGRVSEMERVCRNAEPAPAI